MKAGNLTLAAFLRDVEDRGVCPGTWQFSYEKAVVECARDNGLIYTRNVSNGTVWEVTDRGCAVIDRYRAELDA